MTLVAEDVNENFRRISLSGRLDIAGTDAIDLQFTALSATKPQQLVVDLTAVSFLASIGIRMLVSNAKALQQRGGRMVLYVGDNAAIARTLETTGIDVLLPMFADAGEADKAAQA